MNQPWQSIASDLKISKYTGETQNSFLIRLIYSSLGLWCIKLASNYVDGIYNGTLYTHLMNILNQYLNLAPEARQYFKFDDFPHFLIQLYEQTGYLIRKKRQDFTATYDRTVKVGEKRLYFGYPTEKFESNGLGVYVIGNHNDTSLEDFILRDNLDWKKYLDLYFDEFDFMEDKLNLENLTYFNPMINRPISKAFWSKRVTDKTIAYDEEKHCYYRVMVENNRILTAEFLGEESNDSFYGREYRRLYYALRAAYENPAYANIEKIDTSYSKLSFQSRLPNREYYLLLLCTWPVEKFDDARHFIIKNEFLGQICSRIEWLGIKLKDRGDLKE